MKFVKREVKEGGAGADFLKLQDGESKVGVFRGEMFAFKIKWENNKSVIISESDPSKMNRFKLNFVTPEDGKFVAKIWEFGVTVYDQLADIHSEMPLEKTKIKITRRGTGTDTSYTCIPLGPAVIKEIEAVTLHILDNKKPEPQAEHFAPPSGDDQSWGEELPF